MNGKFFESIKLKDGQLQLLPYHEKRMRETRSFFYDINEEVNLLETIEVPENLRQGLFKCRVSYDRLIRDVEFYPYELKSKTQILLLEIGDNFDYTFKFEDRVFFKNALEENPDVDDVLFLVNGFLTDCTYSNIVLLDGPRWVTPTTRLLTGVKRQYYLDNEVIVEESVKLEDLHKYKKIAFINAMRDFELIYDFEIQNNKLYLTKTPFSA